MHFLAYHVDTVLSLFNLRQLQWNQLATSPEEMHLQCLVLKFTLQPLM